MSGIRYKVLWVDDLSGTQDEIFATGFESVADEKGIDLIPFTNWEEAELELKKNFKSYSSIILDANCKYGKDDNKTEILYSVCNCIVSSYVWRKKTSKALVHSFRRYNEQI